MASDASESHGDPQRIDAPLTGSAAVLICVVNDDGGHGVVREVLRGLDDLTKTVAFRGPSSHASCVTGIGSRVWTQLTGHSPPRDLRPFREIAGGTHTAVSTPGDLLFHIRADRQDLCFEFERLLLEALGTSVTIVDEIHGFRYFDNRDLLGFVDGTANPTGRDLRESTLVGDEDPAHRGGSYVVVQKYLHSLTAWEALTTEEQQGVIGRRKADNVELGDAAVGQKSHKTLATIVEDGTEHHILRDNMPFGRPGDAEFGTYFLGYARRLHTIETMLQRMFIGDPPGLHDRILDFSTAATGTVFFAPTITFLGCV